MNMAIPRRGRVRLLGDLRDRQPVPARTGLSLVRIPAQW